MQAKIAPTAKTSMLIRRPVHEVYEAFVDPAVTTRFWFTKSTGRLDEHDRVRWDWEMYDVHSDVEVVGARPGRAHRHHVVRLPGPGAGRVDLHRPGRRNHVRRDRRLGLRRRT